jgi:2-polyprenyl-3-methyl-5-hydroxy-6-metoxy-1,4-benzoquinol methylase
MRPPRVESVACNLCGGSRATPFAHARDRLHGVEGQYTYVRCEDCDLVYMNPQVVEEDLPLLYPEAEYEPFQPAAVRRQRRGVAAFVRDAPYVGQLLRETLSPIVVDDRTAAGLTSESRWLDVGCGNGAYLTRVRARTGSRVFGLDTSAAAVAVARSNGLDVIRGTVHDAPWPDESFSVVSGWWFLEHVPDPVPVSRRIAQLLEPGGVCVFAVPNHASLNARLFGSSWYHLDCPRHLTLWTRRTMHRLLRGAGLEVDRVGFDKSPWGLLGSIDHALASRAGGLRRALQSRLLSAALTPWTLATAAFRVSDTIVVYGRKRS